MNVPPAPGSPRHAEGETRTVVRSRRALSSAHARRGRARGRTRGGGDAGWRFGSREARTAGSSLCRTLEQVRIAPAEDGRTTGAPNQDRRKRTTRDWRNRLFGSADAFGRPMAGDLDALHPRKDHVVSLEAFGLRVGLRCELT